MKRTTLATSAALAAAALLLAGCGGAAAGADPTDVAPTGEIEVREISWLLSRPADGGVITAMEQIADEYAAEHPGFALNLITTRTGPPTSNAWRPWLPPTSCPSCSTSTRRRSRRNWPTRAG